jgi:hypothetical protein
MDMAVAGNILVQASHFPFPGLGHINRKDDEWRWKAIETE